MKRTTWLGLFLSLGALGCGGSKTCDEVPGTLVFDGAFALGLECWVARGEGISVTDPEDEEVERAPWITVAAPADGTPRESISLNSNRFRLEEFEPLTLSFRARADALRTLWIDISGEESGLFGYDNRVTLEPAWETYTLQFESNMTADDSVLYFFFGEQTEGVEIDDITLERG